MTRLPPNTRAFLASIGCTARRLGDDAWMVRDLLAKPGDRSIFDGATISSTTLFPLAPATPSAEERPNCVSGGSRASL